MHDGERGTTGLAGRPTAAGVGVARSGVVRSADRGGAGRHAGRGEPMAAPGARRRARGAADPAAARQATAADGGAAGAAAGAVVGGSGGLWLRRRRVDYRASGGRDQARLRRGLPSRPCESAAAPDRLDAPAAGEAGEPAQRGGGDGVAGAGLARPSSKARAEQRTILFVDEAGFYPLPFVARTYAPRGQTPVLRAPLTHDHLSVISAITPDGRLFTHVQAQPFRGPAIVGFLRQLLRQVRGKLLVIWDGAPIHRAQPVKEFLAAGAAARQQLVQLPGYAPDLNPDEGVWNLLKRVELRNRCCQDLDELRWELGLAIRRLRRTAQRLIGCFRQCGYVHSPAPQLV